MCIRDREGEDNQSLDQEGEAVKSAFDHFTDLGLKGGLLIADGRPVAYTMGSPCLLYTSCWGR